MLKVYTTKEVFKDKDPTQFMKALSEDWIRIVHNHFNNERGLAGQRLSAWKPLAPSTIEQRKKKGYTGMILQRTGILKNSIQPFYTKNSFGVGTNLKYAPPHEKGAKIKLASRSELFKRNRYSRGSKKGSFKKGTTFGKGFTRQASTITIPRRPFIMPSNTELDRLVKNLINYLSS
jgi:phage gpG-like protein